MNHYDVHHSFALRDLSFNHNLEKPQTMTNLIARKNLFRLSEYFFSLALWWERAGVMTLQKIFFRAWEKCLDTRDKLR